METYIDELGFLRIPKNKYHDGNIVTSYKGRQINLDKPILVYRNLHKKLYSIKQGNIVVAHAERFCVRDFETKVNLKGREKVLRTKTKNVHAFIKGYYETSGMGTGADRNDLGVRIEYNPYEYPFFVSKNLTINTLKIIGGIFCILDKDGVKGSYTISERINSRVI